MYLASKFVNMEYILKEKAFSIGDDFVVKDREGNKQFVIDGKAFQIGEKLIIKNREGEKIGRIRKKMVALKKTYEIFKGKERIAKVKKKKGLFRKKIKIQLEDGTLYKAKGNLLGREYKIVSDKEEVASVSKKRFKLKDSYAIEISDQVDPVLVLATAVIIDLMYFEKKA